MTYETTRRGGAIIFDWLAAHVGKDSVSFQLLHPKVALRISDCADKTAFQELKLHIRTQKQENNMSDAEKY